MNQRAVIMIVILFALIVVGMFLFALMKNKEIKEEVATAPAALEEENIDSNSGSYSNIDRVDVKHFYIDGIHTLAGELVMPTPCDLLEAESTVAESFPEQVHISFTVLNNAEVCAQVMTAQRFKVSATASSEAVFSATLEGSAIELNLFEAAPGETPDEFELFIKG